MLDRGWLNLRLGKRSVSTKIVVTKTVDPRNMDASEFGYCAILSELPLDSLGPGHAVEDGSLSLPEAFDYL